MCGSRGPAPTTEMKSAYSNHTHFIPIRKLTAMIKIGDTFPKFSLTAVDGKPFDDITIDNVFETI